MINIKENRTSDVPKVVFKDLKLQVAIGQWLGILSSQQVSISKHLNSEELMKKINIPTEELKKIVTKFGLLLKLAGIEKIETCILNQFDEDNFSFNCHFNNSGGDANISLKWDMMHFFHEFTISYQNESKTYEYWEEYKERPTRLILQHYTIKNSENVNSFSRYLFPHKSCFSLQDGEYSFSIEIYRPINIKIDSSNTFRIKNEKQLQQYLLGLTFPFEINEIYKKISEISIDSITEYPIFNLKVERKLDEKKNKITDIVSLKYGKLKKFIITKEGRTIAIDSDGTWSYDSLKLNISQNNKGNINFSLNSIRRDELLNMESFFEQYSEINQEVEEVRKLTKNMLNNEN